MSDIYKGELQDYEGNTIYPHSEADVIFCTDGETTQSKLNKYEKALGNVMGVTDSLEVDDSKILVSAKALHKVNSSLQDSSSGESFNFGSLNGVRGFFTDPSKADDSFIPFKSGNDVKVISLSGTGRVSKNIDFSYLANYSALTNDAFAVCPTGIQNYGSSPNTSLTISTSYNAKTGILTVTANEADGFRFNVNNVCVYVK